MRSKKILQHFPVENSDLGESVFHAWKKAGRSIDTKTGKAMVTRVFLDWDGPVVDKAAARLLALEGRSLRRVCVVVPTESSGRRLREELRRRSGEENMTLPRVMTSEALVYSCMEAGEREALRWAQYMAWGSVLKSLDLREFPALFRLPAVERTTAWACNLGEQFIRLRQDLAEADMGIEEVCGRLSSGVVRPGIFIPETEIDRWLDMRRLECKVLQRQESWGMRDPDLEVRDAVKKSGVPFWIDRVVLLAHPDPMVLSLTLLASWNRQGLPVETWIHAPEEWEAAFDEWGRPLEAAWKETLVPLPGGNDAVSVADAPEDMAREAARRISSWQASSDQVALGVCDPEFTSVVESEMDGKGWRVYRAEGHRLLSCGWTRLWRAVRDVLQDADRLAPWEGLLRMRLVQDVLGMEKGFELVCRLDEIRSRHLPETASFARSLLTAEEKDEWDRLALWLAEWQSGGVGRRMLQFVRLWMKKNVPGMVIPEDGAMAEPEEKVNLPEAGSALDSRGAALARVAEKGAELVASLEERGIICSLDEAFLVMDRYLAQNRVYDDRAQAHVDLVNWLELEFAPEPYLLIAALHEGIVPASQGADPFLPEKFRRFLGLRGNSQRLARDAFLLNGMIQSRQRQGGVAFCLSRFSPSGEPCNPSSLLMRCTAEELPARVLKLFPQETGTRSLPAPARGDWVLSLPVRENRWANPETAFSPSLLNSFLQCPFRFWLKNVYGFDRLELSASVPANELGNVIHSTMEELGRSDWRDCADGVLAGKRLKEVFDALFSERFGVKLSLPLTVQYELGMKRMEAAGHVHAAEVREGWHIVETERKVGRWPLAGGYLLNMRVDCVQENEDGRLRILDYKSSRRAKSPEEAHCKKVNARVEECLRRFFPGLPLFERTGSGGRSAICRWINLQLPLYALWARTAYPGRDVSVGYFNIPLNLDEVSVSGWSNMEDCLLDNAREWSLSIMDILREGCWSSLPSAEALGWAVYPNDDFLKLGGDGLEGAFGLNREEQE